MDPSIDRIMDMRDNMDANGSEELRAAQVVITLDDREMIFNASTVEPPSANPWENIIQLTFLEGTQTRGNLALKEPLSHVSIYGAHVQEGMRFEAGAGIRALMSESVAGLIRTGYGTYEILRMDAVFIGGQSLRARRLGEGELEVTGTARHVAVNGNIISRTISSFIPTEVTAAGIGAAVTFMMTAFWFRRR